MKTPVLLPLILTPKWTFQLSPEHFVSTTKILFPPLFLNCSYCGSENTKGQDWNNWMGAVPAREKDRACLLLWACYKPSHFASQLLSKTRKYRSQPSTSQQTSNCTVYHKNNCCSSANCLTLMGHWWVSGCFSPGCALQYVSGYLNMTPSVQLAWQ